ncbi:MAG: RNA polymerase subunit sigma [Phycisphaerae bacterium]|nr:RNA polymerase subunit sigma [Phycisphaerae bacterium]
MNGSASAASDMWGMVYEDLRLMAASALKQESDSIGLQPTQVVHEVFIRLDRNSPKDWDDRRHFFGAAVRAMEQFLIDHARKRKALKRGAGRNPISFSVLAGELACFAHAEEAESQGLIGALAKLADVDPNAAEVTRFRWLLGMTIDQTATLLDRSPSDVRRDWTFARAFLQRCLSESED